jgi:hypothetical protein
VPQLHVRIALENALHVVSVMRAGTGFCLKWSEKLHAKLN